MPRPILDRKEARELPGERMATVLVDVATLSARCAPSVPSGSRAAHGRRRWDMAQAHGDERFERRGAGSIARQSASNVGSIG